MKGKGGNIGEVMIFLHCIAWLATALQCVMKVKRKVVCKKMISLHCIMQLWICVTHDESEAKRFSLTALSLLVHCSIRCGDATVRHEGARVVNFVVGCLHTLDSCLALPLIKSDP